ncbi:DNA cytosine methyltransferase [Ruegeria sp. HKCCE3926]|uniref:DNA cytosine methyltransferase n=1 Tax=Ruegeria sp. HKCCE3926 TaxID=2794831 RepID=UPI001AE224BF|nr:DNA cytosine methyltransferase [Ruegeria sp. HKCCE3926]
MAYIEAEPCAERRLELLSLFCGCGGLDLGFEQAGFHTALAYDRRASSLKSWNHNFESGTALNRDINELTLEQMDADYGGVFRPSAVIGGPPCQGFSLANRTGSLADPRNKLVERFFDLVISLDERAPLEFVVMENVPAIVGKRGGQIVEKQTQRLESRGFEVTQVILDAANYGVPQSRRRFFLVAVRGCENLEISWCAPEPFSDVVSVKQAIGQLPQPVYFDKKFRAADIPFHPNHWCMTPKSPKFKTGELTEGYVAKRSFKTLKWDEPSYTAAYGNREVHVHPSGKRRLSVLEAMIIQGFPREFNLLGTLSEQITQVSEAVPPPLARAVASAVVKYFDQQQSKLNYSGPASQASYPSFGSSTG